jgi:hypothetical protein
MHPHADDTASEACGEVDEQIACASEGHFDERPDLEEHVHIEGDMDDAEVNEAGGEQAPVFVPPDGVGGEVTAPIEHVLKRRLGEGDAARHHGCKDEYVDRDQGDRDGVGVGAGGGGGLHVVIVLALALDGRVLPIDNHHHQSATCSISSMAAARYSFRLP